jgi:glycosyltransferase involved in cell wall biosynthesis
VGGLVERKGFHRVIECLPVLAREQPSILFLIVGGAGPEGDWSSQLVRQVAALGMQDHVRFVGAVSPERLKLPLSAADVFVLATRNEGWANVFLEAMACGLPVVTTDVGGNAEVVSDKALGLLVPFGDQPALMGALRDAMARSWNQDAILAHARRNSWDDRVASLLSEFAEIGRVIAEAPLAAGRKV